MKITSIYIDNDRNLSGNNIVFEPMCNFIIGDNNIGKSNVLRFLETIFTKRCFNYEDFSDVTQPIKIHFSLKLSNAELGHFEDSFDVDDYSRINIDCIQDSPEGNMRFCHSEIVKDLFQCHE